MFDFSAMYDEIYAVIGVPAMLTAGTAGDHADRDRRDEAEDFDKRQCGGSYS